MNLLALLLIAGLGAWAYWSGRSRAIALVEGRIFDLHSLPGYHGVFAALCAVLPPTFLLFVVLAWGPSSDLPGTATSALILFGLLGVAAAGALLARRRVSAELRARIWVERAILGALMACAAVAILVTVGIILSLVFETMRFFALVPVQDFLLGLQWSPQTALRADQVGSSGSFGAVPVFAGTLLITAIAMAVAVPTGLFSAIYLSEFAGPRARAILKPLLEILAGVPTVVYGFFAALTVGPFFRNAGAFFGISVASESALAAGAIMGVMIIPFVSSLSDDVIRAVPQSLREASLAMGATESETIRQVVLPAALPGIASAVLLALSRAIGETMIVVMAAGLAAKLTANPLDAVTTVTVQIVTLLVGDQEFDSAKTLAVFALGLVLFFATLFINVVALMIVRKYRERYD
ncbi:MAG: phosphate ABC transporter permease subunit PstC [Deltaproteobacteria bacterium]|nr:phosphate ABC transporter permease subunit PstC [Deltaproteobacteria bacterium]